MHRRSDSSSSCLFGGLRLSASISFGNPKYLPFHRPYLVASEGSSAAAVCGGSDRKQTFRSSAVLCALLPRCRLFSFLFLFFFSELSYYPFSFSPTAAEPADLRFGTFRGCREVLSLFFSPFRRGTHFLKSHFLLCVFCQEVSRWKRCLRSMIGIGCI